MVVRTLKYAGGVLLALGLVGCISDEYAAEVGYRKGDSVVWDVWGDFDSLDECRKAAIFRYNVLNFDSPGRATSWACLLKDRNGGFESRHR